MATIKKISLFALTAFCAAFLLAFVLPTATHASAQSETLISEFTSKNDPVRSAAGVEDNVESYTQWNNFNVAEWFGGSSCFPDIMSLSLKSGIEGASDGKVLKAGFIGYKYTPAVGFRLDFGKNISYAECAKITFRIYMHVDTSGLSEIKLYSFNGRTFYKFTTAVQDEWIDVEIMNDDLINVFNEGYFSGVDVIVRFDQVRNGNYQDHYSAYWEKTFEADPSYMYFDKVTYTPYEKTVNFTFDYDEALSGISNRNVGVRSAKVARPEDPYLLGYTFGGWYTNKSYSELFDFSSEVTEDTTVYAKFNSIGEFPEGVITDFTYPATAIGYAHFTHESYTEWANHPLRQNIGAPSLPESGTEFVTGLEGSVDGNALKLNFAGFRYTTAIGFSMEFPYAVSSEKIGKIVLRTFMHVDTDGCSVIKLYSADGASHFDFSTEDSDEWVDIEIKGENLKKVLTKSTFKELKFIMVFGSVRNGNYEDENSVFWGGLFKADPSYMYLDTLTWYGLHDVTLDINGKTENIKTIDGEPLTVPYTPEKPGMLFTGWTMNGAPYDAKSPVTSDISVKAEFSEEVSDYSAYYGVYANGDDRVILNADRTAFIISSGKYKEYTYSISASGILVTSAEGQFAFDAIQPGKITIGDKEYTSVEKIAVTYKWLENERSVYLGSGDSAINLKVYVNHYHFGGWMVNGELCDFTVPVADGAIITADMKLDEVEDYTDYIGTYYYASGDSLIVLKNNNKAEILVGKDVKDVTYYLFKGEIGMYVYEGEEIEFEYTAQNIKTEVGRHRRLKKYTVSFVNGEERVNVTVDDGYYKVTEPADPVKDGADFLGWYDEDTGEKFDFDSVVNSSITLKAVFSDNTAVVSSESGKKKGCRGSLSASALAGLTLVAAAMFVSKKKAR